MELLEEIEVADIFETNCFTVNKRRKYLSCSLARYNHSCVANVYLKHGVDARGAISCTVFTTRNVKAGEELAWNYE